MWALQAEHRREERLSMEDEHRHNACTEVPLREGLPMPIGNRCMR